MAVMVLAGVGCVPPGLEEHHYICRDYVQPGMAESWLDGDTVVVDLQSSRREEATPDDWHYLAVRVKPRNGLSALYAHWGWPSSDLVSTADPARESAIEWTEFPLEPGITYEVEVHAEWSSRPDRDGMLSRCELSRGFFSTD